MDWPKKKVTLTPLTPLTQGVGAPQPLASIANVDRNLGLVLDTLGKPGLRECTNIMLVSDHRFGQELLAGGSRPAMR